jgi:UDP-N-acetylglucosamine 2-epimerase
LSREKSFDTRMPDEVKRKVADHYSDNLFAVSEGYMKNIRRERIPEHWISVVGDTMYEHIRSQNKLKSAL